MSYARIRIRNVLEKAIPAVQGLGRPKCEAEIQEALERALPNEEWNYRVWVGPFNRLERQVCIYRGDDSVVVRMLQINKIWVLALPKRTGTGGALIHSVIHHR